MSYHVCPYCGNHSEEYFHEDDLPAESFLATCDGCKQSYGVLAETEIRFRSYPDCSLNGMKHEYSDSTSPLCMVCCKPRGELE